MHGAGILLFVKMLPYGVPSAILELRPSAAKQPGRLFKILALASVPANEGSEEKSPTRSAAVGTLTVSPDARRRMPSPSDGTQKKVVSFLSCAPTATPS